MTPQEYQEGVEQLKQEIEKIVLDAPFVQSFELVGQLTNRIFNKGKASDGTQIGTYDDKRKQTFLTKKNKSAFNKKQLKKLEETGEELTYKELRQARGLQVAFVDLQFTGALFESIKNGKTNDGAVIGFNNLEEAKIASYNEKKYKKAIFAPSQFEQQTSIELMNKYIATKISESIKLIFK
jgi:hypothetical protein